jgi:hypothetical protein
MPLRRAFVQGELSFCLFLKLCCYTPGVVCSRGAVSPGCTATCLPRLDCVALPCRELPGRVGDVLTQEQYAMVEELGVMVDRSGDGTLLQARAFSSCCLLFCITLQAPFCKCGF